MHRILFLLFLAKTQATIQVGRIQGVSWTLNQSAIGNGYINISNTTCEQCLCQMFAMNNLSASIACQQKWKTCQVLFWNATAQLQQDETSIVYFRTIPVFLQSTVSQQSSTTSTSSTISVALTMGPATSSAAITTMNNPATIITTIKTTKTMTTTSTTSTSTSTSSTSTSTTSTSTTSTTTTTATSIFLVNPGGELGTLNPWIRSGNSAPILDNGKGNGANIVPYSGSYAFFGGSGGGSLRQKVPLTNMFSSAQLDSNLLFASVSFWELSRDTSATDTGQVTLNFLSMTNTNLSTVTTGPKTCTPFWCYVTGNWSLPKGTRTIEYMMVFVANLGSTADAWIDDNILNVV